MKEDDVNELLAAARALLAKIDTMTTADFFLGGERPERERLRVILHAFVDDPAEAVTPDDDQLAEWLDAGVCEALDGCSVELDGHCPHGQPSWLLHLGLI